MHLSSVPTFNKRKEADLLVIPFWQIEKGVKCASPNASFDALYAQALKSGDFKGKEGEILVLYPSKEKEERLLLLGLGKEKECSSEALRKAYSAVIKFCRQKKLRSLNAAFPLTKTSSAEFALEGMLLANYAFDELKASELKNDPSTVVEKISLINITEKDWESCQRRAKISEAVNFARDLVNGNADDITPQKLSQTAKQLEKEFSSITTTIFDKKRIEKEKMGLLLAVNRGASNDPAFIIVEYKGNSKSTEKTAIIGKGVTYDTGGLNLKPTGSMETMKDDMSGAAAVLGTLRAAASLRLKVNIIGVIPSTENAIGPHSYKPGDVYKSYEGTTVEISNTDAEGRLILADALAYVQKNYSPKRMIDLATLTGGIIIALGEEVSGLFSNDDDLAKDLMAAGESTYERVWRLPIYPEYKEGLKSKIADIRNSADRKASSITGAMFLLHFIKDTAWAHLDIAGTAFLSQPKHYHPTNATGVGVRLLTDYFAHKASP